MIILNYGQGTTVRKFTDMGMSDVSFLISFIRLVSGSVAVTLSLCVSVSVSLTVCQIRQQTGRESVKILPFFNLH